MDWRKDVSTLPPYFSLIPQATNHIFCTSVCRMKRRSFCSELFPLHCPFSVPLTLNNLYLTWYLKIKTKRSPHSNTDSWKSHRERYGGHTGTLCVLLSWRNLQCLEHDSKTNDPFTARFQTTITWRPFAGLTLWAYLWGKLFPFKRSERLCID